ncbi:NADP-dependent phosphogluconate dehydrogenase [Halocynthiibacter namhaensis]|uniref:NADP-dependent phosphogluconate dehydrogenase n=1 Tax=Halocynthiibacter namhaensis TaxID=1290553 RepID=UPI000578E636|nr:NADP-dependent phosphogluconate dehydrogenase [Halocynthiibacter namhaensis]
MSDTNVGLIGLGTMGSALALNIAEKGFNLAVTTLRPERVDAFLNDAADLHGNISDHLTGAKSPEEMVAALTSPRSLILLVPAGKAVDAIVETYAPLLEPGDTIIDAGNANFHNTRKRAELLAAKGLHFVGMGVSGGEEGARHGPSIMVGGAAESFVPIRPMIEAISAKFEGDPCADWLGPDGAGHFVKTVHNGIEYADMQLISEVYGLLRDGEAVAPKDIGVLFEGWNAGGLSSYLMEISAEILQTTDPDTGAPMVDVIKDKAGQKGTGRWTVIEALSLGQSASAIEAAVGARGWSADLAARARGEALFPGVGQKAVVFDRDDLEAALLAARIIAYAQGFQVLTAASEEYDWNVDMARVAEIWRAGCIIRSALLDDISDAFRGDLPDGRLLFAPAFHDALSKGSDAMRRVIASAIAQGLPVPGFSAALAWFDTMRQARGTTNMVQAQRDFFGAHGFERLDQSGVHHGPWGS